MGFATFSSFFVLGLNSNPKWYWDNFPVCSRPDTFFQNKLMFILIKNIGINKHIFVNSKRNTLWKTIFGEKAKTKNWKPVYSQRLTQHQAKQKYLIQLSKILQVRGWCVTFLHLRVNYLSYKDQSMMNSNYPILKLLK